MSESKQLQAQIKSAREQVEFLEGLMLVHPDNSVIKQCWYQAKCTQIEAQQSLNELALLNVQRADNYIADDRWL